MNTQLAQYVAYDDRPKFRGRPQVDCSGDAACVLPVKLAICETFGVTMEDIDGPVRQREIAYARMAGYLIASEVTNLSWVRIARTFGDRDHATVMKGVRSIRRAAAADFELLEKIIVTKHRLLHQLFGNRV